MSIRDAALFESAADTAVTPLWAIVFHPLPPFKVERAVACYHLARSPNYPSVPGTDGTLSLRLAPKGLFKVLSEACYRHIQGMRLNAKNDPLAFH